MSGTFEPLQGHFNSHHILIDRVLICWSTTLLFSIIGLTDFKTAENFQPYKAFLDLSLGYSGSMDKTLSIVGFVLDLFVIVRKKPQICKLLFKLNALTLIGIKYEWVY